MTFDRLARIAALGAMCCLVTPISAQEARIPPKTGGLIPPIITPTLPTFPTFPDRPRDGWLRSITFDKDGKPVTSDETRAIQANILRALPGDVSGRPLGEITQTAQEAARRICCLTVTVGVVYQGATAQITWTQKK